MTNPEPPPEHGPDQRWPALADWIVQATPAMADRIAAAIHTGTRYTAACDRIIAECLTGISLGLINRVIDDDADLVSGIGVMYSLRALGQPVGDDIWTHLHDLATERLDLRAHQTVPTITPGAQSALDGVIAAATPQYPHSARAVVDATVDAWILAAPGTLPAVITWLNDTVIAALVAAGKEPSHAEEDEDDPFSGAADGGGSARGDSPGPPGASEGLADAVGDRGP